MSKYMIISVPYKSCKNNRYTGEREKDTENKREREHQKKVQWPQKFHFREERGTEGEGREAIHGVEQKDTQGKDFMEFSLAHRQCFQMVCVW